MAKLKGTDISLLAQVASKEALATLIEGLDDPNYRMRLEVVSALVGIPDDEIALALLRQMSLESDERVKEALREGLLQRTKLNLEIVFGALDHDQIEVRRGALSFLGEVDDLKALDKLFLKLKIGDQVERRAAADSLYRAVDLAHRGKGSVLTQEALSEYLKKVLNEFHENTYVVAATMLYRLGRSSLVWDAFVKVPQENKGAVRELLTGLNSKELAPMFMIGLQHESAEIRDISLQVLGRAADMDAASGLLGVLDLLEPEVRSKAQEIIDRAGLPAAYQNMLSEGNPSLRMDAIRMLGRLGGDRYLPVLGSLTNDSDPHVRRELAAVLGKIESSRVVEPLLKLVGDRNEAVQEAALDALVKFDDPRVKMVLLKNLNSLREGVRLRVLRSLEARAERDSEVRARDDASDIAAEISRDIGDADPDVRMRAVKMIELIGSSAPEVAEELLNLALSDSDARVRAAVVRVVGAMGNRRLLQNLAGVLNDPDERVRADAVEATSRAGESWAADPLFLLLRDPDNRVRANAALALWRLGHPEIIRTLIEMLTDKDEWMRSSAVWALGEMRSQKALNAIGRILEVDKSESVRENAKKAIEKIKSGGS